MGEQQVLARGLHVVEGPQQAAPTISCGAAAKVVRSGRHLHARVAGVHGRHVDASPELSADRLDDFVQRRLDLA